MVQIGYINDNLVFLFVAFEVKFGRIGAAKAFMFKVYSL